MDLVGGEQAIRRDAERRRHAGTVLRDTRGRVVGADAAIEAGIDAVGHAAGAREEGVADAGQRGEGIRLQHAHIVKPGRAGSFGAERAIALTRRPMPVRSSLIRRSSAAWTATACFGGAPALSAAARSS